jgi:hypothetical protein
MRLQKLFIATCLVMSTAWANNSQEIIFNGQDGDELNLTTTKSETRYNYEERDSTCTREVPYEEEVCGNETRYREECRWKEGRNSCRTEYERTCRTVTRYRQECSQTPGRRVCRRQPPRQQCRTTPRGETRCRNIPGREICENKPGRRTCRQVPYQDRECTRTPRQVCQWEPGRNICEQVPYEEWVCRMVTRYREEEYACRITVPVPYEFTKNIIGQYSLEYNDQNTSASKASFLFTLNPEGNLTIIGEDLSEDTSLIFIKKVLNRNDSDDVLNIEGKVKVRFSNKRKFMAPITEGIHSVSLRTSKISFTLGKVPKTKHLKIKLRIVRDGMFSGPKTLLNKELSDDQFSLINKENKSLITIDFSQFNLSLKTKKYKISLEASLNLDREEILNPPTKLKTSRSLKLKAR